MTDYFSIRNIDLGTEYRDAFQELPHTAERTSGQMRQTATG